MTNFDVNWERWCRISIVKHFDNGKGDTKCFVEGYTRDTEKLADYIEVRIDGPSPQEVTRNKWKLTFLVNILVVAKKSQDVYRLNRLKGRITKLFFDCIEVRRWGNGTEDDQEEIGCLKLLSPHGGDDVQVIDWGQLKPDTEILQASVEGTYEIKFD